MSTRFMLSLTDNRTNEEYWFQLFGNYDYFETFAKYIRTLGAPIYDEEEFLFNDTIIPDLDGLIKAIDETVWNDIIKNNIEINKNDPYVHYSKSLNFSHNLLNREGNPYCSLFSATYQTVNYSYMGMSYSVYLWLKKYNAIVDEHMRDIKHDYFDMSDYVILGKLNPHFTLTISRY